MTHFHLLRANSVPYSIPNKNSTLSKIPRHWELSLKEYNTLYVIIEMARGTVVHIGNTYSTWRITKLSFGLAFDGRGDLIQPTGEGGGFQATEMNEST